MPASPLEIVLVPCLSDNYGILVHDSTTGETVAIDSPEVVPLLRELEVRGRRLTQIWNTHHHPDHTGGNLDLEAITGCTVVGPRAERERIPGLRVAVDEGASVRVGRHEGRVLEVPGHTLGHVAYWLEADGVVFVGDTLFSLGCGRVFEGTPVQMWRSLCKLAALPEGTLVYCAHEYTQGNARFALTVDPGNTDLVARAQEVDAARSQGRPTLPTTIGLERRTNPFLRAESPMIRKALGMEDAEPVEVFAELRRRKDHF